MSAGIWRAMIFSNKVIFPPFFLLYHQGATRATILARHAGTQEFHDLIVQRLAAPAPAPRPDELFYARTDALEAEQLRRLPKLDPQFIPQTREKEQLATLARLRHQPAKIGLHHARDGIA